MVGDLHFLILKLQYLHNQVLLVLYKLSMHLGLVQLDKLLELIGALVQLLQQTLLLHLPQLLS